MGFHQAEDSGQFFPRIPHFWTPEDLLFKAQQLGKVDMGKLKCSIFLTARVGYKSCVTFLKDTRRVLVTIHLLY